MKKGDILITLILIVAFTVYFFVNNVNTISKNKKVVIEVNGKTYKEYWLDSIHSDQKINIQISNKKSMDVVVSKSGIYVEQVDCPDQICKKTGHIIEAGESIICLPNKVIIYIEGHNNVEVDSVTY